MIVCWDNILRVVFVYRSLGQWGRNSYKNRGRNSMKKRVNIKLDENYWKLIFKPIIVFECLRVSSG